MIRAHYRIGQAAGISINLQGNGEAVIHACCVTVKDNKLDIDKKLIDLNGVDELKKHFPQNTLVSLILFGKGILQKQVEKFDEINPATFAQILPNGNPHDFYIQHFVSGESSFVSVIRKSEADKWINAIKELGFTPLLLSLAPFPVENIIPQLNFYDNEIVFDGHLIHRNDSGDWINYKYEAGSSAGFPLKISSEGMNEKLILPYAAAFQLALSPDAELIRADVDTLQIQFEKELSIKKLKVKGFIALVSFFVLLLINFFAFSWLYSANEELSQQVDLSARNVNDREGVVDEIKAKEALLKTLGWDDGLNKAALLDQLASLLPDEIRLLAIAVNPIDASATRAQRALSFSDRKIKITGSSDNIMPVNEWVARIKTLKWVKSVQMDSYVFNSELNAGQFTLTITY